MDGSQVSMGRNSFPGRFADACLQKIGGFISDLPIFCVEMMNFIYLHFFSFREESWDSLGTLAFETYACTNDLVFARAQSCQEILKKSFFQPKQV